MKYKVIIMYDNEYKGYVVDVPELVWLYESRKNNR